MKWATSEKVIVSDSGKVKYHREDTIGKYNRYIGIHQYFFVASFLDPRVAPLLSNLQYA